MSRAATKPRSPMVETLDGWVTGVFRLTAGDTLAAAADVGDTVLELVEIADFVNAEGRCQAMVSGDLYDIDEVDADANTITLASPLTVAAAVDDPVDLFDPEVGGTVVVGYEADVELDDSDPTDRSIRVEVSHALVPMLEESTRGGYAEAVVLTRASEHDWQIHQVDGKLATNLIADEAIAAADSAFDQALAALTEAQLALAIADGFVDIYYQTSAPWANGSTAHDDDTGDIWVDTDAATGTAYRWLDRMWTAIGDASIVAALLAAQSAQTTADGKIRLYVQATPPTLVTNPELSYGDLWRETDADNKEYYWNGASWVPLLLGDDGIVAELVGKILTAGFIRTAASGSRIEMYNDGAGGRLDFYFATGNPGYINPVDLGGGQVGINLFSGSTGAYVGCRVRVLSSYSGVGPRFVIDQGGLEVDDLAEFLSGIDVVGGADIDGGLDLSGGLTAGGTITLSSLTGTGGATLLGIGNAGVIQRLGNYSTGAADSGGTGFRIVRVPN